MKRFFAVAVTLMLALAGFPVYGQTDEQIRDYLTNDECYWPDFQRNPSFKICPPEDMVRATGGRGGPGWIVTPHWKQYTWERDQRPLPGMTVTYSCNVAEYRHKGNPPYCLDYVSVRVDRNPDMATKGEHIPGYGYDLDMHMHVLSRPGGQIGGDFRIVRLYKHEVQAFIHAAFETLGISGGYHGVECTNPDVRYYGLRRFELVDPISHREWRLSWDGGRLPFGYQPEFRIGAGYPPCNLGFRTHSYRQ